MTSRSPRRRFLPMWGIREILAEANWDRFSFGSVESETPFSNGKMVPTTGVEPARSAVLRAYIVFIYMHI